MGPCARQDRHDGFVGARGPTRGGIELPAQRRTERQLGVGYGELRESGQVAGNDVAVRAGLDCPANRAREKTPACGPQPRLSTTRAVGNRCLRAEMVCALTIGAMTMSVDGGALRRSTTTKPGPSW